MTVQAALASSSPVDSATFAFDVNGQSFAPTSIGLSTDAAAEGGLRHYTASLRHDFSPGTSTLGFVATGPRGAGRIRKIARVRVAEAGDFTISEVVNYPNPFEASTGFHYNITQSVDRLRVRIYTISGHLLRELADPDVEGGTHFLGWDGTDADGDPIANGTYIYKVVAELGTKKLEKIGTLVRVRR